MAALAGCDAWTTPVGDAPALTYPEYLVELEREHAAAVRRLDEIGRLYEESKDEDYRVYYERLEEYFATLPPEHRVP